MTSSVLVWAALAALVTSPLLVWISREPVRGLYLAFFATAVLATPSLPVVREKVAAPEIIMVMTWVAMLMNPRAAHGMGPPLTPRQRTALRVGALFVGWILLSFLINGLTYQSSFAPSLVETANYIYGFLIFATVVRLVDDHEKWSRCLIAWICGAALVSLVGAWTLFGGAPGWAYDEFTGRVSSTLKFENQVPSFLLPIFPAVVLLAVTRTVPGRARLLLAALVLGMIVTVFASGSRTGLAMLAICMVGALYIAAREARHRALSTGLLTLLAVGLIAGLSLFIAYVYANQQSDYQIGATPPWQRSVLMLGDWLEGERPLDETRPAQMRMVLEKLPEFIVFGTGPKLFTLRFNVAEVHNTYAGVLIEVGLIGFLLFLIWLIYVLVIGWRSASACPRPEYRLVALALLIGFIALQVYGMFIFGLRQRNIWLLAGLLIALPRLNALTELQLARAEAATDQHGQKPRRFRRLYGIASRPVRRKLSARRVRPAANAAIDP